MKVQAKDSSLAYRMVMLRTRALVSARWQLNIVSFLLTQQSRGPILESNFCSAPTLKTLVGRRPLCFDEVGERAGTHASVFGTDEKASFTLQILAANAGIPARVIGWCAEERTV